MAQRSRFATRLKTPLTRLKPNDHLTSVQPYRYIPRRKTRGENAATSFENMAFHPVIPVFYGY